MPQEGRFFLDPQKFCILADRVRSWAPAILDHCKDEDENRALRLDILDTISFLERGQRCLEAKASGHVQYPSQTLISAACLGNLLGSNEHVGNVVPLCLQVALPGVGLLWILHSCLSVERGGAMYRVFIMLGQTHLLSVAGNGSC